ncbi:phage tail tip protein [Escherichia coli]
MAVRTITVRVYDDQPFDRQIVIPAVAFSGARHGESIMTFIHHAV